MRGPNKVLWEHSGGEAKLASPPNPWCSGKAAACPWDVRLKNSKVRLFKGKKLEGTGSLVPCQDYRLARLAL